ncbi:hypothetical protein CK203_083734 [Vitis vinifera]|uniref:Uncharacterized protein n=1 Tax=Vitis vinifera TaxID=29760 RepID=A0A438F0G9_VITVI|nr:hypothetical protein CK203_083734 [Vitis vinifera]
MVETSRDWSEKLPFALWAYRTSFRTSTGATPYSLVYGMEAMLPVEIEMGSLRVALEQQIPEADWAQARFDQLNLLDERRLRAADHVRADPRGKFRPNWSGPYFIRELTPEGAAWLMDLDGNRFSEPTNVDQLKSDPSRVRYYFASSLHISLSVHLLHLSPYRYHIHVRHPQFPFISIPYHLGLRYVPCLKTTLRPWDQCRLRSLYLDRSDSVVFGLPGSFMDPHGLARSSLTGCSSRRGHDRYLTEPLRSIQPGPHFSTLGCHHASPSGRPVAHLMPYGAYSVSEDLYGSSQRSHILRGAFLSHSARFIPFDIVVIPGWSCLWCLDFPRHHFRGPWRRSFSHIFVTISITRSRYIVFASLTIIPELSAERRSRLVESLSAISSGLRFAVACHTGASRAITIISFLASRVITVISFRLPEPSLSSRFGFQSHHCHLPELTVILFWLPEPLLSSCLGFQSHFYHLVLASRAITVISFRLPEPSLSSRFGFQSHHCHLPEPLLSSCLGFQSHYRHLVLASRAITVILFRLPESSLSSRLGFQSHHCHLV